MSKFEREVKSLLADCGLPYEIVAGRKHHEVYLAGKRMLVFSHGGAGRDTLLLQTAIKRRRRELDQIAA